MRYKPEAGKLEMTLPIVCEEKNRNLLAPEHTQIDSLTLTSVSAKTDAHGGGVVIGTMRDGALYLTGVDSVYQMRPSLQHLDAADSANKTQEPPVEELADEDDKIPLQVQVKRRETQRQTELRLHSHAYLRQREQDESWVTLQPSMSDSEAAADVKAKFMVEHQELCGLPLTAREYLDIMCPVSSTKLAAQPVTDDVYSLGDGSGLSKSTLSALPLERRIRALFAKGQKSCLKYHRIRQFITEDISEETIIRLIQDCAYLVQGNWVAKSTLRCNNDVTYENMRDAALFQFARSRRVKPELVSSCLKRNGQNDPALVKMRRDVMTELSLPRGYGSNAEGWEFIENTDQSFIDDFPDVVQKEMESWLALAPSLDTTLHSEDLVTPSVPPHVSSLRITTVCSLIKAKFEKRTHIALADIRGYLLTQAADIAGCAYFRQAELLGMFDGELACIKGLCVLVNTGDPAVDALRRKILGVLYKKGGVVKRAEIMEALGANAPSQHTYTKILSDLCTSKGSTWTIKPADELKF